MTNISDADAALLADAATVGVDATRFFAVENPQHIAPKLSIALTQHCFLPRTDDLQADWVASVAAPAFKILAARREARSRNAFCSIGTGAGLDALAAAEFLEAELIGVTDVHDDVVAAARHNILTNLQAGRSVKVLSGTGDLLSPLRSDKPKFDVIYENLPNVPVAQNVDVADARISSGFFPPRLELIPDFVHKNMLALHYVALLQARDFLAKGGIILSMLGGRVPLQAFLDMSREAGFRPGFLTYGWKVQAQAEEIIDGHAQWQKLGLGPFHFYRISDLEKIFAGIDPIEAAKRALEIEKELAPYSIDAFAAAEIVKRGENVGHTYAVLTSEWP